MRDEVTLIVEFYYVRWQVWEKPPTFGGKQTPQRTIIHERHLTILKSDQLCQPQNFQSIA